MFILIRVKWSQRNAWAAFWGSGALGTGPRYLAIDNGEPSMPARRCALRRKPESYWMSSSTLRSKAPVDDSIVGWTY